MIAATFDDAKRIVLNWLNPDPSMEIHGDEWVILDQDTIETAFCWIFRHTSRLALETGRDLTVYGVRRLLVVKEDGSVLPVPTAEFSTMTWVTIYESRLRPSLFHSIVANLYMLSDQLRWIIKRD